MYVASSGLRSTQHIEEIMAFARLRCGLFAGWPLKGEVRVRAEWHLGEECLCGSVWGQPHSCRSNVEQLKQAAALGKSVHSHLS